MNLKGNSLASESSNPAEKCFELEFSLQLLRQISIGFLLQWADTFQLKSYRAPQKQHFPCPVHKKSLISNFTQLQAFNSTFGVKMGSLGRSKSNKRFFLSAIEHLKLHFTINEIRLVIKSKTSSLFIQFKKNAYRRHNVDINRSNFL